MAIVPFIVFSREPFGADEGLRICRKFLMNPQKYATSHSLHDSPLLCGSTAGPEAPQRRKLERYAICDCLHGDLRGPCS